MHELSVAQNIVATVVQVARENSVHKVKSVLVEIGPLSGVVEESLQFCFPIALKGSGFEGMQLKVNKMPLKVLCHKCGAKTTLTEIDLKCTSCNESDVEIVSGKELLINSIEVE